jgi:hypothetical protein
VSDNGFHAHHAGPSATSHVTTPPAGSGSDTLVIDNGPAPADIDPQEMATVRTSAAGGPSRGEAPDKPIATSGPGRAVRRIGSVPIEPRTSTVLLAAVWIGLFILYVLVRPGG